MGKRICRLRQLWVSEQEKKIKFGLGMKWADIEADEATFDKQDISKDLKGNKSKCIMWEQWCGIVQRGRPETLVLIKLKPKLTHRRAPGPGPIRKLEWTHIARKHLQDRKVVFHTDPARAHKLKVPGVVHDRVVHCKKRVKKGKKWVWQTPKYCQLVRHKLPGGKVLKVKSGTQVIDRCWRFLKERISLNGATKAGSSMLQAKLRSAQYEYWHRCDDLWVHTGKLCAWYAGRIW
ncbi:unnamed protein product [Effrenium voratum]|nr:unnamed protein product [Effrenium voratum]